MNLYEMTNGYNEIFDMVMDDDVNLDVLEDTLQAIEGGIEEKVENGIRLIKTLEYRQAAMKAEADRLIKNQKAIKNNIDRIKSWYKVNMGLLGKKKIATCVGSMNVQLKPAKLVLDEVKLPADYFKIIPQAFEPDKDKIKADLSVGKQIPGAELVREQSLRIR